MPCVYKTSTKKRYLLVILLFPAKYHTITTRYFATNYKITSHQLPINLLVLDLEQVFEGGMWERYTTQQEYAAQYYFWQQLSRPLFGLNKHQSGIICCQCY